MGLLHTVSYLQSRVTTYVKRQGHMTNNQDGKKKQQKQIDDPHN